MNTRGKDYLVYSSSVFLGELFDVNVGSTRSIQLIFALQRTGAEESSTPVKKTIETFNVLNKIADFGSTTSDVNEDKQEGTNASSKIQEMPIQIESTNHTPNSSEAINLSYTINLNLPPTTDVEVFNAIFKSLKEHLLKE